MNEELRQLALQEIKNLWVHATKEELARLDHNAINPFSIDNCIYGQLTGDCDSGRAHELIRLCTWAIYKLDDDIRITVGFGPMEIERADLDMVYRAQNFLSPLELALFFMTHKQKEETVSYLSGMIATCSL